MIAIVDPQASDAVMVGEGHAPAVAVLPGMSKRSVPSQSCLCQAFSRGSPLRDSECPARWPRQPVFLRFAEGHSLSF